MVRPYIYITSTILLSLILHSCTQDKLEPCNTNGNISFSEQVYPILNNSCIGCHSGSTPGGGIDQSTWAAVNLTVDDGSFLGSIRHDSNYERMPMNAPKLNNCDILLIETWVNEGALDN